MSTNVNGTEVSKRSLFSVIREAISGSDRDFTTAPLGTAIFLLAVPMIVEMFAESLFAIVDIFFVAHIGADAVAVVGITESMMFLVYSVAIGIAVGATATVARRFGEGDLDGAARTATHAMYLGLAASTVLGVIGLIFAADFLRLMGAEESVVATGTTFTQIMLGGDMVVLALFLLNAIFRGAGDAAIAMRVLWLANILNIILGPCFILGLGPFPELGVTGAAVGTVIGRFCGALYAAYCLFFGDRRIKIRAEHWRVDRSLLWRLVKVSAPAVLQFFVQTASWIGLVRVVTGFGTTAVAGYQIGIRMVMFALLPSIGLANAAATLVGQNLGAGKPDRAEEAVWKAVFYNVIVQTAIGIIFVIFAGSIASVFTTEPEVHAYATDALRVIAYGFFFYAVGMVLETAFNGAGDTMTPTYIALGVFWLFEIPLAYFLAYYLELGAHGAFWAITIAFSVLAVVSAAIFKRGKWKLKVV
ncbi:MAG: MATE efflux family protein [Acidobacteria bacterium OLB17]|nr:MAG: MATE efflux family protein [Acidobacteria bacterium OLB17]MCZ2390678.1 MATE family efflux transporter [Acidobacteriota bacterium]